MNSVEKLEKRKARKALTPHQLLTDPEITTVSLREAGLILGVGHSTIYAYYKKTGCVVNGLPALKVGGRILVPLAHLRNILGYSSRKLNKKGEANE